MLFSQISVRFISEGKSTFKLSLLGCHYDYFDSKEFFEINNNNNNQTKLKNKYRTRNHCTQQPVACPPFTVFIFLTALLKYILQTIQPFRP